jgi:zinc/manganese transport system permease protein
MFSGFMVNAWTVASIVAVVAGLVGFFVVLRGSAFVAHAIPNGSFAGAAGASLIGVSTLLGFGVFALFGSLSIGALGRRGRHDVATALTLVLMLGLGALFVSLNVEYGPEVYSLLFGEVLGVSTSQLIPTAGLAVLCVIAIALLYRPLMLSSLLPDVAEARGIATARIDLLFLAVVALSTTMTVPVVGTLLIFSLMIGAPAAALSYQTNYPVGFFVGTLSAACYTVGRVWAARRRSANIGRGINTAASSGEPATGRITLNA